MILTCPQCSTRYQAGSAEFQPAGRRVRCAKCGHVWHQPPRLPDPEPEFAILGTNPDMEGAAPEASQWWWHRNSTAPPEKRQGDAGGATAAWIGLAIILFLVGWTAIFFRGDIAAVVPQSATVYKAVGLRLAASGVQFVAVSNRLETDSGTHVLIVSGKVVNRTNHELAVPRIRIALTDRHRRELYHWPVTPDMASLKPGEATPFRTRLANPPEDIHQVKVTFAKSDE